MNQSTLTDVLELARGRFIEGNYRSAEPLLKQLLLRDGGNPEIFQMLGTIYYDQGKFNLAIKTFRKALEIDPTYTDASIGLSIILNDLGRYDEGRDVFEKAQEVMDQQSLRRDPYTEERLAAKHEELGELYLQCKRPKEALDQFFRALHLSTRKPEITMKVVDCLDKTGSARRAVKELKQLVRDFPQFIPARIRLGKLYYGSDKILEAVDQWESVLLRDPEHPEALRLVKIAQEVGVGQTI